MTMQNRFPFGFIT